MPPANRLVDAALVVATIGLTLATAYIHFWVGGFLLMLNAAGYATLAAAVAGTAILLVRVLPLVLIALAAYTGATIVGWLVMGPYFDVAYLAKAIEVALLVTIAVQLRRRAAETRASINWALDIASAGVRVVTRRPAAPVDGRSADR